MRTQHTPGPWIAEKNGETEERPWTVGKLFYCVADVGAEPDARLIAAAPDLLAASKLALVVVSRDVREGRCPSGVESHLRAALSKAEGAQ